MSLETRLAALAAVVGADIKFLRARVPVPRVTSLAAGQGGIPDPIPDNFAVCYIADAAAGVLWNLRYNAGSVSPYKWEIDGGSPVSKLQIGDFITQTNLTYTTDGNSPSFVLPFSGDYDVEFSSGMADVTPNGQLLYYTVATVIAGATDARSLRVRVDNGVGQSRTVRLINLAAGASIAMYSKVTSGTGRMYDRSIRVLPVRVG